MIFEFTYVYTCAITYLLKLNILNMNLCFICVDSVSKQFSKRCVSKNTIALSGNARIQVFALNQAYNTLYFTVSGDFVFLSLNALYYGFIL